MSQPSGQETGRRPLDASMTLLREVMDHPLDPSYAITAGTPHAITRRGTAFTVLLAVVAGAAFSVSVSSIRQPQRQSSEVNNQLREQFSRRSTAVEQLEASNAALRQEIAMMQQNALGVGGAGLATQAETLGVSAGEVPVVGPGLRLILDDAPTSDEAVGGDPRAEHEFSGGIVLDADMQMIINGLWVAGAEAIAINGERLTALSAIRSAGQAILVDFRPLERPYTIEAIGDSSELQAGFASSTSGPYVQSMRDNSGIRVDISSADKLVLPGAGQLVLRQAHPSPTLTSAPNEEVK